MLKSFGPAVLFGMAVLGGPAFALPVEKPAAPRVLTEEEIFAVDLRAAIATLPATDEQRKAIRDGIGRFYAARGHQPIWLLRGEPGFRARALQEELGRAGDWGLDPEDYAVATSAAGASASTVADVELSFTIAAVTYARHAHSGRIDPATISRIIDRGSTPPEAGAVLEALATSETPAKVLLTYHPRHDQFERLRRKLIELRGSAAAASAESEIRIPDGPVLKPGQRHAQVVVLRERLKVSLPKDAPPADVELYDEELQAAVLNYQKEKGLAVDGLVGRGVRNALNGTIPDRPERQIERILVNMERWRWLPESLGEFYVMNNVPEFMQFVVHDGKVIRHERIIVGKGDTPTPTFSKRLEYLEFMPFWNVPNSIKLNEIGPDLAAGRDVLSQHNLRVNYNGRPVDPYSVDWGSVDPRKFHFFQPPGGGNVLGVVKFMFPNRHDTYMHDTPSKSLFGQSVRMLSHGCMRVKDPLDLAGKILGYDQGWGMAQVNAAVARGNNRVDLKKEVMVHVTYFTLRIEDDGRVSTFGDVYGQDRRVALAMNGATNLIAEEDALRPKVVADAGPSLYDTFSVKQRSLAQDLRENRR
jgi:murein L,D-transpeptidase YcbB/YkuD